MKSDLWVICGVALFCFTIVRCNKNLLNNGDYALDTAENKDYTEKEEDTENEFKNVINVFEKLSRSDPDPIPDPDPNPDVCDGVTCFNGGACPDDEGKGVCKCDNEFTGDKCEIFPKAECVKKNKKCDETGGTCLTVDEQNVKCDCPEGFEYQTDVGCKDVCEGVDCFNGGACPDDDGKGVCKCVNGFTGDKCEIFPKAECIKKIKKCGETGGTCLTVDEENVKCDCYEGFGYQTDVGCKDVCEGVNCFNGGTCPDDDGKGVCKCDNGFTGDKCEIFPKAECVKKIKKCGETGGTCLTVDEQNVKCDCPEGFEYQTDVGCKDPCAGVTCFNGGVCADVEGVCKCINEFTGDQCEKFPKEKCATKIKNCDETGGNCLSVDQQNVKCECPQGTKYQEDVGCTDPCAGVTCFNGGVCPDDDGNGACKCDKGFTGDKCEKFPKAECVAKIKKCDETGGTCLTVDEENVKCDCPKGSEYQTDVGCKAVDVCQGVTCFNGGVCPDDSGKGACKCVNGFTGEKCEIFPKDECQKKLNKCDETKGTCLSVDKETVKCDCPEGFEYQTDDVGCKDKCADFNCNNEGTCVIKSGNAACTCEEGFTGDKCQKLTKDACKSALANCDDTEGTCIQEDGKDLRCECPVGNKYNEEKGCEKIVVDFCKDVCGEDTGATCEGDKSKKDKITCTCEDENDAFDYANKACKINYCKDKCGGGVKCINPFDEETVKCDCENDDKDYIEEEKKCKINYCRKTCGTEEGVNCEGDQYVTKKASDCKCEDSDKKFKLKKCLKKCSENDDCLYEGTCGDDKLCKCTPGTTGETCSIITKCESGDLKNCRDGKGECVFKDKKAACICTEDKKFSESIGYCGVECKDDKTCDGNRVCNGDNVCVCKKGYEGDDCDVVSGCKTLKEKCDKIKTDCIFDKDSTDMATCKCKEGYNYNREKGECQDTYCFPNPCGNVKCIYEESVKSGYCKCEDNKFYNYKTGKCQEPDKCLLRKTPCGENQKCEKGECKCAFKVKEGEECKKKLCSPDPCFTGSKCSEDDGTCSTCEEGKFYNGKICESFECDIKNFKTSCKCPLNTKREKDGEECAIPKDKSCDKDCGYGICYKVNDKDTCKCFPSISTSVGGKCILNKKVCASGQIDKGLMTCLCKDKLVQADDGITCRLRTCDDEEAKKDCASKGGVCKMNWKGSGYYCECPYGYAQDNANGKCLDPCSLEKNIKECSTKEQFCFNSISTLNKVTSQCSCPPTFKKVDDKCTGKAENVYLINNIPVLKKKYEMRSGIDKVLLNADLIQSMQLTFKEDLFDYGYLYDYKVEGDIIKCSVWINFKRAAKKTELNTVKLIPKKFSEVCDECNSDVLVWPPNLFLSDTGLKEAASNKLDFCSPEVIGLLCGKGAGCKDKNKCVCKDGYKLIEFSGRDFGDYKIQRCEDIDECAMGMDTCSKNTTCINKDGTYKCVCNEGYKKGETPEDPETDKTDCYDMCTPSPCVKGKCSLKGNSFDCQCDPGAGGSLCDKKDVNYASAKKSTVVVGAVLGTILAVAALAFLYYIIKLRKSSASEDFITSPRMDHAEMTERRNMRGVTNKGYE